MTQVASRFLPILLRLLVISSFLSAPILFAADLDVPQDVALYQYEAKGGISLEKLLAGFRVGAPTSRGTIRYNLSEWVATNQALNPGVKNWKAVPKGTKIVLAIPASLAGRHRAKQKDDFPPYASGRGTLVKLTKPIDLDAAARNIIRSLSGVSANEERLAEVRAANAHLGKRPQLKKNDLVLIPAPAGSGLTGEAPQTPAENPPLATTPSASEKLPVPTGAETKSSEEIAAATEAKADQEVVANAKDKSLDEITDLPPEKVKEIPPEVIKEKLDDKTIAGMSAESADKIPPEVVESKAKDVSFFDSFKPGMSNLFDKLGQKTAAGYAGVRFGLSLAESGEKLMSKVKVIGLLLELRNPPVDGLRVYWDYVPKVSATVDGEKQQVEWSRAYLAWAFTIKSPWIVDSFHITPKIGRYSLDTRLPVGTDEDGVVVVNDLKVGGALGLGLELDAELAKYFYILRVWAARDLSGKEIGLKRNESILSSRFGVDGFLKGGGFSLFGATVSTQYLLYASLENLELRGRNEESGKFSVNVSLPHAGLGISLGW